MPTLLPDAFATPTASPIPTAAHDLAGLARAAVHRARRAEAPGKGGSALPPDVMMAQIRLHDQVMQMVEAGQDEVINLALALLGGTEAPDIQPLMLLSDVLDDVTLDHRSMDDDPLALLLVPMMLACPADERRLVIPADAISELYGAWSGIFDEQLYFVDPVLWRPAQAYEARYREVARLQPVEDNDDLAADEADFADGERLGLRFLAVWVAADDDSVLDDMIGTRPSGEAGVDQAPPDWLESAGNVEEGADPDSPLGNAVTVTEALFEDLTGQPAYALAPADFYTARREALGFRAHYEAFDLITRQLELGQPRFTAREMHLACSMHGIPAKAGSDDGIVDELRISVLSPFGALLAQHAISLRDRTLAPEAAVKLAVALADHLAQGKVRLIDGLHDTRGEAETGPLYFAGPQYLSGGHLPLEAPAPSVPVRTQLH